MDITAAGIAINGIMVFLNNGGSAGSGSGCSPKAPDAPVDPVDAAGGKAGAKSSAKTASDFGNDEHGNPSSTEVMDYVNSEKENQNNELSNSSKTGAFNPESKFTGNGLGRLAGKKIRVSEKGLNLVKDHLSQFGDFPHNTAMIKRLEEALVSGHKISGADASFYLHEIAEAKMMKRGIPYDVAHDAALKKYNVSPFSVYSPEVIKDNPSLFNDNWRSFWGINK